VANDHHDSPGGVVPLNCTPTAKSAVIDYLLLMIIVITSDQSNLTTGCIAAAHGQFSGFCQVTPVCSRT